MDDLRVKRSRWPLDPPEVPVTAADPRVSVVVATRNRASELLTTLEHLRSLPEQPHIVVVDNASTDGTSEAVRRHPEVEVVTLAETSGAPDATSRSGG
ncbi:MAG TPA: glycosyltransferase [Rubrobacteraceae bacterium]|nr:glycosyltransferase [Rubrobacteraceae bacterium]